MKGEEQLRFSKVGGGNGVEVIFSILVSILEYILLGKMHSIISQEEVAQPAWQGVEVETSIAVFLPMNQILIRLNQEC